MRDNGKETRVEQMRKQFLKDVANHNIRVVLDQGVNRHLMFRSREANPYGIGWFDIITWDGSLCITGDYGTYVFQRVPDMFNFFRDSDPIEELRPNVGYWSEKCVAQDRNNGLSEYSPKCAREVVLECVESFAEEFKLSAVQKQVLTKDVLDNIYFDEGEIRFRDAILAYEFDPDGDSVSESIGTVSSDDLFPDFWEHSLTEPNRQYLWCLFAIVWGIQQYDALERAGGHDGY